MKSTLDFHPKFLASLASYSKEKFTKDLMAGIIVGIVALPLAIAFGTASGVSPDKGLITAIIDGCNNFSVLWRVPFPGLKPVTLKVVLLNQITYCFFA